MAQSCDNLFDTQSLLDGSLFLRGEYLENRTKILLLVDLGVIRFNLDVDKEKADDVERDGRTCLTRPNQLSATCGDRESAD